MKTNTDTSAGRKSSNRTTRSIDTMRSAIGFVLAMFLMIAVACVAPAFADDTADAQETNLVPPAIMMADAPHDGMSAFIDTIEAVINTKASKVYAAQAQAQIEAFEATGASAVLQAQSENELQDRTLQAADNATATVVGQPAVDRPEAIEAAIPVQPSSALQIGDAVIPYVDSYLSSVAPDSTAGIWWGSDSTTDGDLGYFIGHNPGVFACVLDLTAASPVTVWDSSGNALTYHVIDMFDVPNTATLEQLQSRIGGHGESIVLQTCIQNGEFYRIIVAA